MMKPHVCPVLGHFLKTNQTPTMFKPVVLVALVLALSVCVSASPGLLAPAGLDRLACMQLLASKGIGLAMTGLAGVVKVRSKCYSILPSAESVVSLLLKVTEMSLGTDNTTVVSALEERIRIGRYGESEKCST